MLNHDQLHKENYYLVDTATLYADKKIGDLVVGSSEKVYLFGTNTIEGTIVGEEGGVLICL